MTLQDYFDAIDILEIERFVADGQEENVTLEFKTVNHPHYNDANRNDDRKNFSKVLSGFANSVGGIVIWGVKASTKQGRDVADRLVPITELTKFLNSLNKLEGQAVIPLISGVIHVKLDTGGDQGYIQSFIPASDSAPHMALYGDKHYYKRSGDSFYPCEHFDISDMFSRKKSPNLEFYTRVLGKTKMINEKYRYDIVLGIRNNGKALAKFPYLAVNCNHHYRASEYGVDGNRNTGLPKAARDQRYRFNYADGSEVVIYPDGELDVDTFITEVYGGDAPQDFEITYVLAAENMDSKTDTVILDTRSILIDAVKIS